MRITLLLIAKLIVVIMMVITESAMAEDYNSTDVTRQMLVIEPEPLAKKDVLTTLDIVSKQEKMGSSNSLSVLEGEITVGKLLLYSLKAPVEATAQLLSTPNSKPWRYYLVVFPFTLNPPPPKRRYKEMIFKIVVSSPQITAFQLLPKEVVREEEVTEIFDIGFSISLSGETNNAEASAEASTKKTQTVKFTRLRPIITAFGDRQNDFFWKFTGPSESPVEPGSRRTAAILQVPSGVNRLTGTILWQVDLERRFFEDWLNVPVTVDALPFELQLN